MSPFVIVFLIRHLGELQHESYTSVAIAGAQDCLAEIERGGTIRVASGVDITVVRTILLGWSYKYRFTTDVVK